MEEIPILTGYLLVPTQSGFSINRISKKKPCHRYCQLYKSSQYGIERLEIYESKEDKNPKIITLENCVKITYENSAVNIIHIVKKTETLTLNALSDEEQKEWVSALQMVAFRDKSHLFSPRIAIEEDNDLYCSSLSDGMFLITLIPSETSKRCNIEPKTYMLFLTTTELQLKSIEDISIIAKWPYRFIRKYGYRDGKFTFEAGRKCTTGEGVFTLDHTNPQDVFRCMSAKMKSMKKLISAGDINKIEFIENQLSAAACMEAGSRSPLPPIRSGQHNIDFETNSTRSSVSLNGFISSNDSLNNMVLNTTSNNFHNGPRPQMLLKCIPSKPQKKLFSLDILSLNSSVTNKLKSTPPCDPIFSSKYKSGNYNISKNYETVSPKCTSSKIFKTKSPEVQKLLVGNDSDKILTPRNYECIESITNAWKTLGVGNIKHTERNNTDIGDNYLIDIVFQHSQRDKPLLKELSFNNSKILDIDIGESSNNKLLIDSSYDHLDFLLPNNGTCSGYKTVVTLTGQGNPPGLSTSSLNEYELIETSNIVSTQKADDSHLGYGILRKIDLTKKESLLNASDSWKLQYSEHTPFEKNSENTIESTFEK